MVDGELSCEKPSLPAMSPPSAGHSQVMTRRWMLIGVTPTVLSSHTRMFGDARLLEGVPWASSALVVPLPEPANPESVPALCGEQEGGSGFILQGWVQVEGSGLRVGNNQGWYYMAESEGFVASNIRGLRDQICTT